MRCASLAIGERLFALSLCAIAAGCGELRPRAGDQRCEAYDTAVQPLLTTSCVDCHGPAKAEGGYRLDTRDGAVAHAADGSTRVEGGVDSSFIKAITGALAGHSALEAAAQQTLTEWAVDCKAGPGPIKWHPRGWFTPADESFHGLFLRKTGYRVESPADDRTVGCTGCHGADLDGGASKVSCQQCHGQDVFACKTCHGDATTAAPPKSLSGATATTVIGVGAHRSHVEDGPLHLAYTCDVCHVTPKEVRDDGHFQTAGQPEDGIAEVVLHRDGGTATWTREDATCTNTACHAPFAADTAAIKQKPTWTKVKQGEADCGTCHGNPPSTHSSDTACGTCHQAAFVDGGVVRALHANGIIEVGRPGETSTTLTCASCHGAGAPFRDTHGNTDHAQVTVGAHDAHLRGSLRLTRTIGCGDCHLVPAQVRDAGHLDTPGPAEVFPPSTAFAHTDNATADWNPTAATCSNVYCHGGGSRAALDTAPSKVAAVVWTGTGSQVYCGSCHGIPPTTPIHVGQGSLSGCATCHGATISSSGSLKTSIGPDGGVQTTHLNGIVETGT